MKKLTFFIFAITLFAVPLQLEAGALDVVINEVAWMGTTNSYTDEWIELYNNTESNINLEGWTLKSNDDSPDIALSGSIPAKGYFLLERTDDTSAEPEADQIYTGSLKNQSESFPGEYLKLRNTNETLIDEVDRWHAGNNDKKQTMEKKDPTLAGTVSENWADGPKGGTPKKQNDNFIQPEEETENDTTTDTNNDTDSNADSETNTNTDTDTSTDTDTNNSSDTDSNTDADAEEEVKLKTDGEEANNTTTKDESGTGDQNSEEGATKTDDVILNELMPNPEGSDSDNEWIEIYNNGDETYNIGGWKLDDFDSENNAYTIPEGSTILPGEYKLFGIQATGLYLSNDGDGARLIYSDNKIADEREYTKDAEEGNSYARFGNEWKWTTKDTPGSTNELAEPREQSSSVNNQNTNSTEQSSDGSGEAKSDGSASEGNKTKSNTPEADGLSANISKGASTSMFIPILMAALMAALGGGGYFVYKTKIKQLKG